VLASSTSYYHAAMLMQHGIDSLAYHQAYEWARESEALDSTRVEVRWLVAAAWDRYQMSRGEPQWYGTQSDRLDYGKGALVLYNIEPGRVTDRERKYRNVGTIDALCDRLTAINKQLKLHSPGCMTRQDSMTAIGKAARVTLRIPGYADFLALDTGGAWVTNSGRVERLVADAPGPVASVAMPEPCGAMAVDFGALWVADCKERAVFRVGLESHKVDARVATGLADPTGELSIATGAGSVWILTDATGVLSRIDPGTNTVSATVAVAPGSFAAAFGFGAVWITTTGAASVQRVDPASNRVVATIPVGAEPRFLAAGEGGVWTLNQKDGTVTRIDPATDSVVATIDAGVPGSGGDIATGGGFVWVRAKKTLLLAIDPRTNRIVHRFGPPAGSGAVRANATRVWVTAHDTHEVWVLDIKP